MHPTHRSRTRARIIGAVALVALLVAMVVNTKFLTPAEVAAIAPKPFDPAAIAADLYGRAQQELPGRAKPLGEVVPALQSDVAAAAEQFEATVPAEGSYVFPVELTGTVTEASATALRVEVEGVPSRTPVVVPLTNAVNGTPVRDVMGFKFADAPGQTDYQYVGDELKQLMLTELETTVPDAAGLKGKQVTVLGALGVQATGKAVPPAKPLNVQPVSLEAGS